MPTLLPFPHFTWAWQPSTWLSFNRLQPESSCACPGAWPELRRPSTLPRAWLAFHPTIPALGRLHRSTGSSWSDGRNPVWHLPPHGPRARQPP